MGVRRGWVITAAAMGLALLLALPPRPEPDQAATITQLIWFWRGLPGHWRGNPRWLLDRTHSSLHQRVREGWLGDSLMALVRTGHFVRSADGSIVVVYERPLGADSARHWLSLLEAEAALVPRAAARGGIHAVVALYSDPARAARDSAREDPYWRHRLWVAGSGDSAICVVEANLMRSQRLGSPSFVAADSSGPRARMLDVCALWARLGAPGPAVRDWTRVASTSWGWWRVETFGELVADARRASPSRAQWGEPDFPERACLRGASLQCEWLVGLARWAGQWETPWQNAWSYYGRYSAGVRVRQLLASLLVHREPERFAAFWSSRGSVQEALAAAYGTSAGELVSQWGRSANPMPVAGSGVEARSLFASVGWAVALLAGALFASLHWRTD